MVPLSLSARYRNLKVGLRGENMELMSLMTNMLLRFSGWHFLVGAFSSHIFALGCWYVHYLCHDPCLDLSDFAGEHIYFCECEFVCISSLTMPWLLLEFFESLPISGLSEFGSTCLSTQMWQSGLLYEGGGLAWTLQGEDQNSQLDSPVNHHLETEPSGGKISSSHIILTLCTFNVA